MLFSDGFNSIAHVSFGILSALYPIVIPLFLFYDFSEESDPNITIDVMEFGVGWIAGSK